MKQSVDSPRFSWWDSQLTAQCTPASDSHGKRATPVVETIEGLWHSNRLTDRRFPWKLWLSIFKAEVSWGYKCHRFLDNLEWYSLLDEMLDCWQHRQGVLDQLPVALLQLHPWSFCRAFWAITCVASKSLIRSARSRGQQWQPRYIDDPPLGC